MYQSWQEGTWCRRKQENTENVYSDMLDFCRGVPGIPDATFFDYVTRQSPSVVPDVHVQA